MMQLSDEEFQLIRTLVYNSFGINLGAHKRNLVIARLQKVLLAGGFSSFREYYEHVVRDPTAHSLLTLVDQISTNHTYFFREKEHFDFLAAEVLPAIKNSKRKRNAKNGRTKVRIWSAGCSSGEEPYTLAMLLKEAIDNEKDIDAAILATDISVSVLETAKRGIYPQVKVARVPNYLRQRYFTPLKDGTWEVKQELKEMVLFRRLNLMTPQFKFKGLFDVIFCRNVMIYFDKPTQQELIAKFHRCSEPGGYLFIGHSETIDRNSNLYKYIRPSIYQKK